MTQQHACPGAPPPARARRGVALPAAVIALIIISLFVAGSAFFAVQEMRAARGALTERAALEAAEYGATAIMRDWDPRLNTTMAVGTTSSPRASSLARASASARVTRTSATTFWVASEGLAGTASATAMARRMVNTLYRLDLADPLVTAALTVGDSAEVASGGAVEGADSALAGAAVVPGCAAGAAPVAGVAAADTTHICDGACGGTAGHIRGAPPLLSDPGATDSLRYLAFGTQSWQTLAAAADVVLPPNATVAPAPAVSAGGCLTGLAANWGDPAGTSPCRDFYPVIVASGDLTISGGAGQGILLVAGDLRLDSGAQFTGLVVARDDIVTGAGGGTVLGATLAGDARHAPGDHTVIGSGGLLRYSACGLQRALYGAARLRRVASRSWAELR